MDNQTIMEIIKRSHDDIEKVIASGVSGLHILISANAEIAVTERRNFSDKIDSINDRLDKINGSVASTKIKCAEHDVVLREFRDHQKPEKWVRKNWIAFILLVFLGMSFLISIYDMIGLRMVFETFFSRVH